MIATTQVPSSTALTSTHSTSTKVIRMARLQEIERRTVAKIEDEYKEEVLAHQKKIEIATLPDVSMMDLQPELEWHMRPYLLDFLLESHLSLHLQPQTLFLAVNLIDRYCSRRVVFKKHYQLVGCTALWIAAKYEDKKERVPTVRELKIMCCDAYEEDMFVQMEGHVLSTLEWSISHTTSDACLKQIMRYNCSPTLEHLANYLCELSLYHKAFIGLFPSAIAAAALFVAQRILTNHDIASCASAMPSDVLEAQIVSLFAQYIVHTPSQSLLKKFSSSTFSHVALILQSYISDRQRTVLPPTPPPSSEVLVTSDVKFNSNSNKMIDINEQVSSECTVTNRADSNRHSSYMTPPCTPDEVCPIGFQG
ncbi:cyclin-like protein [Lipomyces oligophaga]|uniref:cyclin-like protein n=1 Tax=Lipomyces oligophaga TaxID=45792 RepID=UPI0034CE9EE3